MTFFNGNSGYSNDFILPIQIVFTNTDTPGSLTLTFFPQSSERISLMVEHELQYIEGSPFIESRINVQTAADSISFPFTSTDVLWLHFPFNNRSV